VDYNLIIAYAFGILLLYLVARLLLVPLRFLVYALYNAVIGGVAIWGLNLAGQYLGFRLALNPATALGVGFLGVPGVILLFVLQRVLG
jgi:inhibitor of the pro-sigma K processing machinery